MVAIKLCKDGGEKHWCREIEDNVGLSGALEATTSIAAMVCCLALLFIGGNKLGNRTELLLASVLYTIGSTIEAESADIPDSTAGLYVLFAGRAVYGFGIGFCMHSMPAYISETAPPKLRGTLGGFIEVGIIVGLIYGVCVREKAGWLPE
jgi:MFS family permease